MYCLLVAVSSNSITSTRVKSNSSVTCINLWPLPTKFSAFFYMHRWQTSQKLLWRKVFKHRSSPGPMMGRIQADLSAPSDQNHSHLARSPTTVWTSTYDTVLDDAYLLAFARQIGKIIKAKFSELDLVLLCLSYHAMMSSALGRPCADSGSPPITVSIHAMICQKSLEILP